MANKSAYRDIVAQIGTYVQTAGRASGSTSLVVVSKTFQAGEIVPVLKEGARMFGENRVQEAMHKWPDLKQQFNDIELHLIGPLQSNKVKEAVGLFDTIHTIDREKIAAVIAREINRQGRKPQLFVQVNTGNEKQKAGVFSQDTIQFIAVCREKYELEISGLMCIPPVGENPGPHFALLRKLAGQCACKNLSMGMSNDFETAIDFGATHVRIGRAIFGDRLSQAR